VRWSRWTARAGISTTPWCCWTRRPARHPLRKVNPALGRAELGERRRWATPWRNAFGRLGVLSATTSTSRPRPWPTEVDTLLYSIAWWRTPAALVRPALAGHRAKLPAQHRRANWTCPDNSPRRRGRLRPVTRDQRRGPDRRAGAEAIGTRSSRRPAIRRTRCRPSVEAAPVVTPRGHAAPPSARFTPHDDVVKLQAGQRHADAVTGRLDWSRPLARLRAVLTRRAPRRLSPFAAPPV